MLANDKNLKYHSISYIINKHGKGQFANIAVFLLVENTSWLGMMRKLGSHGPRKEGLTHY